MVKQQHRRRPILAGMLTLVLIIWVGRVAGLQNGACQQYPCTPGCR
jgi:hypothetical protein